MIKIEIDERIGIQLNVPEFEGIYVQRTMQKNLKRHAPRVGYADPGQISFTGFVLPIIIRLDPKNR